MSCTKVYLDGQEYKVTYRFYGGSEASMYDPGESPCAEIQEIINEDDIDVIDNIPEEMMDEIEYLIIKEERSDFFNRTRKRSVPFLASRDREEFFA